MPDLFDFANPVVHADDPETSHAAAALMDRTGARQRHARMVLELVKQHPGMTAVELWEVAGESLQASLGEMQEVRRRLTDLKRNGHVRDGEARVCRVRGTKQMTWKAVGDA